MKVNCRPGEKFKNPEISEVSSSTSHEMMINQTFISLQVSSHRKLEIRSIQHALVKQFIKNNKEPIFLENEKSVLNKLCSLYAACSIEKRLGDFYAGGFASINSRMDIFIRDGIIQLCKELVDEAVSLTDVLAPPDFIVDSPLGKSDGDVYKHLQQAFFSDPECLERPGWWREILKSKM